MKNNFRISIRLVLWLPVLLLCAPTAFAAGEKAAENRIPESNNTTAANVDHKNAVILLGQKPPEPAVTAGKKPVPAAPAPRKKSKVYFFEPETPQFTPGDPPPVIKKYNPPQSLEEPKIADSKTPDPAPNPV